MTRPGGPNEKYNLGSNVGYLLRRAQQVASAAFLAADDTGLSVIQFATLASLASEGPSSQNRLARSVGSDAATMTGVVQRLQRRGLIKIDVDPADRRMKMVAITADGRAAYEHGVLASNAASAETLAPLSHGERLLLVELLQRILAAATADGTGAA